MNFEAVPAVMLKALLVAPVKTPLLAAKVYPVPVLFMDKPANVATPLTAFTVVVPLSVPPPGFVPIAIVIAAELLTMFPPVSTTLTEMVGVMDAPACAVVGC